MYISINKLKIAENNKTGWVNKFPTIRVSKTKSGKGTYGSKILLLDKNGDLVAEIYQTPDGSALLSCGAKVVIKTHNCLVQVHE